MRKVTVVGAGNVGATVANEIARTNLAGVLMVDVVEGFSLGKALDMAQAAPILGYSVLADGRDELEGIAGSDVVVVTAGIRRKPGMDRRELSNTNAKIIADISKVIKNTAPDAIVILVTNPLDAMCYVAMKETGFPKERIIGMAGVLDSARMAAFIAMELGISPADVRAMVLGGHGDTMVPLPRFTTVNGVPITELLSGERIKAIVQRTRDGGAEIINLLKTASAFYAPGAGAALMVEAVLTGRRRLVPASVWTQGEYGIRDVFVGLPVIIGGKGVEKIIELKLTADELAELKKSADAVKSIMSELSGVAGA